MRVVFALRRLHQSSNHGRQRRNSRTICLTGDQIVNVLLDPQLDISRVSVVLTFFLYLVPLTHISVLFTDCCLSAHISGLHDGRKCSVMFYKTRLKLSVDLFLDLFLLLSHPPYFFRGRTKSRATPPSLRSFKFPRLTLTLNDTFISVIGSHLCFRPHEVSSHPPITEILPPVLIQIARMGYSLVNGCLSEHVARANTDYRARAGSAHPVLEKLLISIGASAASASNHAPSGEQNPQGSRPDGSGYAGTQGAGYATNQKQKMVVNGAGYPVNGSANGDRVKEPGESWGPQRLLMKMSDEAVWFPVTSPRTKQGLDGVNKPSKSPLRKSGGVEPGRSKVQREGLPELRKSGIRSPSLQDNHLRNVLPDGLRANPRPKPLQVEALSPKPQTNPPDFAHSPLAKRNLLGPVSPNHSVDHAPGSLAPLKSTGSRLGESPVVKKFVFGRTIVVKGEDFDERGFLASGESNAASPVRPPGWWAERRKIEIEKIKKARAEKVRVDTWRKICVEV
jgi:hypothetical protein